MPSPLEAARNAFQAAFDRVPIAAALAPARVNLLGDHTDYNLGLAIPIAIEPACVCHAAAIDDPTIHALAIDHNDPAASPTDLTRARAIADKLPAWARLAVGTAAITLDHLKVTTGLNLAFTSNIPPSRGLSSSAAICISIATAIEALHNTPIDPLTLARLCQRAEHEFARTPCGVLDQLAIIHAREHHALRINFNNLSMKHVPIPKTAHFVLIDTNTIHDNASGKYAHRRHACESLARELDAASLSAIDPAHIERECATSDDPRWRLARHVVTENARVEAFAQALAESDLARAGELMNQSHASLSKDYRVSLPEIDALAERICNTPAVLGCRLTGAGLGGSLVALTDSPDTVHTLAAIAPITRIIPSAARRVIVTLQPSPRPGP